MPMRGELPVPAARIHNRAATEPTRILPKLSSADMTVVLCICVIGLTAMLLLLSFFPDLPTDVMPLDQFP